MKTKCFTIADIFYLAFAASLFVRLCLAAKTDDYLWVMFVLWFVPAFVAFRYRVFGVGLALVTFAILSVFSLSLGLALTNIDWNQGDSWDWNPQGLYTQFDNPQYRSMFVTFLFIGNLFLQLPALAIASVITLAYGYGTKDATIQDRRSL